MRKIIFSPAARKILLRRWATIDRFTQPIGSWTPWDEKRAAMLDKYWREFEETGDMDLIEEMKEKIRAIPEEHD